MHSFYFLILCSFSIVFVCKAVIVFQPNYKNCVLIKTTEFRKKHHTIVGKQDFQFPEQIYSLRLSENLILYFKMCGQLDKEFCGGNSVACLSNNRTRKTINFGSQFQFDDSGLTTVNGQNCSLHQKYSLTVKLLCPNHFEIPLPVVNQTDPCKYETLLLDPNCDLPCSVNIAGHILDLSPLKRSYCIDLEESKKYCVSLCDTNQQCVQNNTNRRIDKNDLNACEIANGTSQDISLASTVRAIYNGDKNVISFRGSLHEIGKPKIINHLHVNLKCNWQKQNVSDEDLHYIKKKTQGKFYDFELETIHGCIKKPISCLITEDNFLYDLSAIYSSHREKWRVKNSSSELYLNICGPLELPAGYDECLETYSQVCEKIDGQIVSRGSVLRKLDLVYDVIYATIENGSKCEENPDTQHTTFIEFHCDENEQGPYLKKRENCSTNILWRTPHACPEFDLSRCTNELSLSYGCTFSRNDSYYDLNPIRPQKSVLNGTSEFYISICGSAISDDAPCIKDASVVLVNMSEFNKKKRVFSLGKLSEAQVEDGSLVLKYTSGQYCGLGQDYSSTVIFRCSEIDEGPFLVNETQCSFEFEWKTSHGCSKNESSISNGCTIYDSINNSSYDFHGMQTKIQVTNANITYIFDVCQQNYTQCDKENCSNKVLRSKPSLVSNNKIFVKMFLPTECKKSADFNVVNFEFSCDRINHNEHIQSLQVNDCVLNVKYATSIVCLEQNVHPLTNCRIESPYSESKVNISRLLEYQWMPYSDTCPEAIFNETFSYVKLLYSRKSCASSSNSDNLSFYELFLQCTEDGEPKMLEQKNNCQLHVGGVEFCDYFASETSGTTKIILGSCGVVGILVVLSVLCYWFLRKRGFYTNISCSNYVRENNPKIEVLLVQKAVNLEY